MKPFKLLIIALIVLTMNATAQKISPMLFGQNYWIAEGDEGRRGYIHLLWPQIEASGIKMIRIGGNHYNNREHPIFSDPDGKTLRTILDSIRSIGAEPLFQIPAGKGEETELTLKELTQFVKKHKYANGKGIRYYCIGNEPLLHDRDGIEKVYANMKKFAPVMKAADPTIKIFIFDECSLFEGPHERIVGGDLDLTGKDEKGNWMVDGITFHRYPCGGKFTRDDVIFSCANSIRYQVGRLQEMLEKANKKHGRTGDDMLLWGLTEFNVTTSNPDREISGIGNTSFLGGQFMAEIYGIGLEYGAFTMTPWCISETDAVSTDFGYIGSPMDFYPRSSYYHTQLMALNMKGEFLPTTSTNSYVYTIGSKSDDEICVMIMNRDKYNDFNFDLILNNEKRSNKALVVIADLGLDVKISGSITNQTTMMYVLSKTGEVKRQYTYGISHNFKNLPPEVK